MPPPRRERKNLGRIKGQGSLFLRGRIFWFELNWKGNRYRESLETSDRQTALLKMGDRIAALRSGELPKVFVPITMREMYEAWILSRETDCKPSTYKWYVRTWNKHLRPFFGSMLATDVTLDRITQYFNMRSKKGAGLCTRNRENTILRMIFSHNSDKIPADRFPKFPNKRSEAAYVRKGRLNVEDYKTVLSRLDDTKLFWLKVIFVMTFKYAFRKSELLDAKVGYFDAKASVFTLPAFTTKNKMERRVPIKRDGEIYQMLVQLTAGRPPQDALFIRNGRPVSDYRGAWAKVTKGISGGSGLEGCITIHDLRRSGITGMANKGLNSKDAGTHLTSDVYNRYIQKSPEEQQKTAALIESD